MLIIGGATAYMSSQFGEEDVCRALGKWRSSVRWLYLFAISERVERSGYHVGFEEGPSTMRLRRRLSS